MVKIRNRRKEREQKKEREKEEQEKLKNETPVQSDSRFLTLFNRKKQDPEILSEEGELHGSLEE